MDMTTVKYGSLVRSNKSFSGIGKVIAINTENQTAMVGFFYSPAEPYANQIEVHATDLVVVLKLQINSIIFSKFSKHGRWKSGFYGGQRPHDQHLVIYNKDMNNVLDIEDLYVPNMFGTDEYLPHNYLKEKCTTTPMLVGLREDFFNSYIAQRAACRSMSSLLGSSVELEAHQLAIVSRVLSDEKQKYLLCDEVGLGKTIEAGLILRHHVIEFGRSAKVFIFTPSSLKKQWDSELRKRFHLEDVMGGEWTDTLDDDFDDTQLVFLGDFHDSVKFGEKFGRPTMVVVDEAHQLSSLAWGNNVKDNFCFNTIAELSNGADVALLLTGTPLAGQEKNYLTMLHCLDSSKYKLTEKGVEDFKLKISQQIHIVGLYRALIPTNDNGIIEGVLEDIEALGFADKALQSLIDDVKPFVDFFADEDVIDDGIRQIKVLKARSYFADNYILNYRMLRNRRDSSNGAKDKSNIRHLFPGLGNCEMVSWDLGESQSLIDEQFDDLRSFAFSNQGVCLGLNTDNFTDWIESLLLSPKFFAEKIKAMKNSVSLAVEETEYWDELISVTEEEQIAKDEALNTYIQQWINKHDDGKIVIFCGESSVADHVFVYLGNHLDIGIERHCEDFSPDFITQESIRVLVCDERGEDGLNLQGKRRLAIHYSLPLEVNRIEQRNGRLNRYSAYSYSCSPIETCILVPARNGFYKQWARMLKEGIGVFDHYRASIQEPIDDYLLKSWAKIKLGGFSQLMTMTSYLSSQQGLVAKELKKLDMQDAMDRDTLDVRESVRFSQDLKNIDEYFEEADNANKCVEWMTSGLLLSKIKGEFTNDYRFKYELDRTRINVDALIDHCIIGLDFEHSSYKGPVTKVMSADRSTCARTGAYPLRYGQPFVDAIANLSDELPFGIASALIRQVNAPLNQSSLYFKTQWLVSLGYKKQSISSQINHDKICPPMIVSTYFSANGKEVSTESPMRNLIAAPYSKEQNTVDLGKAIANYHDINISVSHSGSEIVDLWDFIEQEWDETHWKDTIDNVYQCSRKHGIDKFMSNYDYKGTISRKARLLSIQALILVGV
jgi:ATP-dependent helicase HepA